LELNKNVENAATPEVLACQCIPTILDIALPLLTDYLNFQRKTEKYSQYIRRLRVNSI